MALQFYIHLLPFAPKKWVFGSKSGKFWNFQNFRSGSFLSLWRPCHASPRARRCLWAERNSRRWFWVLNSLCATSGSRDMGRQSFLEENQKFQKMHFYHLSPSCVYIHQNGTQRHQLVSYIWKHLSLWVILGVFDRKKLILSPKLVKNTTEKGQNQENQDRPSSEPILLYKLPLVALSSSHMYTKMMVMGNRMGFFDHK